MCPSLPFTVSGLYKRGCQDRVINLRGSVVVVVVVVYFSSSCREAGQATGRDMADPRIAAIDWAIRQ